MKPAGVNETRKAPGVLPAGKFMQMLHSTHVDTVLVKSDRLAYL